MAQNLIDKAVKEKGLPAVSLHPVAIYGPCVSQPTGLTRLIDELRTNQIPVLLKGGLPLVFNEDAARAHILAEQKAEIGEKFLLIDESYSLKEIAEKVSKVCPTAKVPKMMPDLVADLIASIGEAISKLIGKAPLITKSELGVLRRRGRPNGSKIKEQLGWETTSFDDGVRKTIHSLEEL